MSRGEDTNIPISNSETSYISHDEAFDSVVIDPRMRTPMTYCIYMVMGTSGGQDKHEAKAQMTYIVGETWFPHQINIQTLFNTPITLYQNESIKVRH